MIHTTHRNQWEERQVAHSSVGSPIGLLGAVLLPQALASSLHGLFSAVALKHGRSHLFPFTVAYCCIANVFIPLKEAAV